MRIAFRDGCRAQRDALRAYVDGDASGIERLAFERHAEDCAACAAAWRSAQALDRELHRIDHAEPDADFEQRVATAVRARLDALASSAAPATIVLDPATRFSSRRCAAAAALVVAAVLCGWFAANLAHDVAPSPILSSTAPGFGTSAQVPAPDDLVDPVRLAETKAEFTRVLLDCARSSTPLSTFRAESATLRKNGWPVETLLVAAIEDPNDDVARAAIGLAAESRCDLARPALLRADRRPRLRVDATRALGVVADAPVVALLERRLDDPAAWAAALDALESCPRRDALAALESAARDTSHMERAAEARLALARRGPPGARALLALAADGDGDAARVLGDSRVVDAAVVLDLLRVSRDAELARVALETLPDAAALTLIAQHHDAMQDAFGTDAFRRDVDARLQRCFELHDLVRGALRDAPTSAPAWVDLLARHPSAGASTLDAVLADATLALEVRVRAAVALATIDRLDPRVAFDTAVVALPLDLDAAATLLCCAVRAGMAESDVPGLDPKRTRDSFRSARATADRWRADGRPPESWERARIAQKLANARL
ncbi:MAG: zf-HC2 domain-containing protein [Planctomycetes bacterium]|nr:zf-HC2 domain-containing protein [Planctomycetota bacterium]MCC7173042.1 zf-HC2 domain-containing protein [Planctomycetota bacterium]